jgi:hypothetical protein
LSYLERRLTKYTDLGASQIQLIVDVPILLSGSAVTVAVDSTGAKDFPHTQFTVPSEALKHLKSASLIVDYAWADTADGTIQLYDSTAGAVRGESSAKTGGESSPWESISVYGLVYIPYSKSALKWRL